MNIKDIFTLPPLDVMALTVWGEARGEPVAGQTAVAWVIRQRADHPRWWGNDLLTVCLKPSQFSCWNGRNPNFIRLLDSNTRTLESYQAIRQICMAVINADPCESSVPFCDHYCTLAVKDRTAWAKGRTPAFTIGHHAFFRVEL